MFTFEQVKELMELVASRGLAELDIERQGFRLRISGVREAAPAAGSLPFGSASGPSAPAAGAASTVAGAVLASLAAGQAPLAGEAAPVDLHYVTSPIVGTFYAAPAPDAPPFVLPGDRVRKGQVLCIIEAMKLMNEIESDVDGVLVEVLPKNAQPIEYGERLFVVRIS